MLVVNQNNLVYIYIEKRNQILHIFQYGFDDDTKFNKCDS